MKRVFWFGPTVFTKCRGGIQPGRDRLVDDVILSTFAPSALDQMVVVNPSTSSIEHVGSAVDLDYFIHKYPNFKRPLAKATGIAVVATLGNIVKIEAREDLTEEQKQQQAALDLLLSEEADNLIKKSPSTTEPDAPAASKEQAGSDEGKKPRGRPKKIE